MAFATGRRDIPRHAARFQSTPRQSALRFTIPLHFGDGFMGCAVRAAGIPGYASGFRDGICGISVCGSVRLRRLVTLAFRWHSSLA